MDASLIRDPAWRVENLYPIVDKNSRRVKLRLNSIQKRISQDKAKRKVILKARQFGVSTYCLISQLDRTIWTRNHTACILAHEQDAIEKLFRIVRRAYEFMDPNARPALDRGGGSKYEMFFPEINSRIYCDLESRGDTINDLHISEAAFIKEPQRMRSTLQAVPLSGIVTIESTPNGMGNHFYDLWMDEKQSYSKMFYPWFLFEDYQVETREIDRTTDEKEFAEKVIEKYGIEISDQQIAFRRLKATELGPLFPQEYPEDDQGCFLASGNSAMDLAIVKEMLDDCPDPIRETNTLKVFKTPVSDGIYVIGADVAEGVRADYSVASVIEAKSMTQVAVLRGHMKPSEFARRLADLGESFKVRGNLPMIAVERNNHGHATLLELDEHIRYRNLFVAKDDRLGWLTDRVSRPMMIDAFIDAIEHGHLRVLDSVTLKECLTLIDNNGKIEADSGKHDDCVIATAIALSVAMDAVKISRIYQDIGSRILV